MNQRGVSSDEGAEYGSKYIDLLFDVHPYPHLLPWAVGRQNRIVDTSGWNKLPP